MCLRCMRFCCACPYLCWSPLRTLPDFMTAQVCFLGPRFLLAAGRSDCLIDCLQRQLACLQRQPRTVPTSRLGARRHLRQAPLVAHVMCPLYQTCRLVRAWDCSLQLCVRHGIVLAIMRLSRSGSHGSVFAVMRLSALAAIWRLLALLTIYIYIYVYIYICIYAFIYLSLVHAYVCDCCSGARSTSSAGSTCGLPACTPLREKHKQKQ